MGHLHIPDGVLPPLLWAPALLVTLALLVLGARARHRQPAALAGATALAQGVSGLLWLVVVGLALKVAAVPARRMGFVAGLVFPVWALGVLAETVVAFGTGRFLARVRPDLLPSTATGGPR